MLTSAEYGEIGAMTREGHQGIAPCVERIAELTTKLLGWNGEETPAPEIPSGDYPDEVSFDPRALAGHFTNRRTRPKRFRPVQ